MPRSARGVGQASRRRLPQISSRLHCSRKQFRRRNGARHDPGGGSQRAGASRHGEPRQGGQGRADLGALRPESGAPRRPLRQARGSALRLLGRRLQRRRQPRPRRRRDLGANASLRARRRDRHHRILSPRSGSAPAAEARRRGQRVWRKNLQRAKEAAWPIAAPERGAGRSAPIRSTSGSTPPPPPARTAGSGLWSR